jgi:hypothetical protein
MRRPSIPPFDTYREYFTKNWLEWFDSLDNDIKQTRLLLKSYIAHASLAHNDLTGIQGGTTGEYYHLTSADSAEAVIFLNGGTATHTQLDSERTSSISHRADASIHFTDASVLHNNRSDLQGGTAGEYYHLTSADNTELTTFANGGSTTHTAVDTHISDAGLHTLKYDELTHTYTSGLETGGLVKLVGATLKTITKTYDSSDRISTIADGTNTWTFTYSGTGFLTGVLKT